MKDRRALQDELNRVNQLYQDKDLEMRKIGASDMDRQRMRDMLNAKKERLMAEMGDDLQKLNTGAGISVGKGTVSGPSEMLDQSSLPDASKTAGLGKFKRLGQKVAGIVPFAGVAAAALQGNPAMAADELMEDAAGPLAALKPDVAGNRKEERTMLAERKALKNYENSPAYRDRRGISEEDQDVDELYRARKKALEEF
jgi:hypothetical protein